MASLRDLGLSEYESRVFRALLDTGPATAKELSRVSDVPMGRIYDVLNTLEGHEIVRSQAASRPKKYAPVETETALERLLAGKKRELEEQVSQYEAAVDELAGQLGSAGAPDEPFWTVGLGPAEAGDLLVERLRGAGDEIIMVFSTPIDRFERDIVRGVIDALTAALDRDVAVRVITTEAVLEMVDDERIEYYRDRLEGREGFIARVHPDVTGTFELIDRTEVCIEVPHPLGGGETFAVIDLTDREFAADVETAFEERWTEAEPLEL